MSIALLQNPPQQVRVGSIHPAIRVKNDEALLRPALPFDPSVEKTAQLQELASETGAYLLIGYAVQTPEGLRNEATVLTPQSEFLDVFGKDHPVTLGGETSIIHGMYSVYDTQLGKVGTIIYYDMDFTDTARKVVKNGAQIVAVPSFDWPAVASKHYTHLLCSARLKTVSVW
ncbi:MAG: carbon-nitrogen hydrolase family protein [Bacillota bacterium]